MLLSKEIAVELNLTGCKLKQFIAARLRQMNVPLTPEQFMLIDLLWNHGEMSQQQLADRLQKDKNSVTKLVDTIMVPFYRYATWLFRLIARNVSAR